MSDSNDDLQRQLQSLSPEELARLLTSLGVPPPAPTIAVDQSGHSGGPSAGAANTYGDHAQIGDTVHGPKIEGGVKSDEGVNIAGRDQIITNFYGGEPPEQGADLLADYLNALWNHYAALGLTGIGTKRKGGDGQSRIPLLQLADVFTNLTTDGDAVVLHEEVVLAGVAKERLKQPDVAQHSPKDVPPEDVRQLDWMFREQPDAAFFQRSGKREEDLSLADLPAEMPLRLRLTRPPLAQEVIAQHPRLVLLGAPGSGKSTVLRYVVLQLAAGRLPFGWPKQMVPIFCPLGHVASALERKRPDQSDASVLWDILHGLLDGEGGLRTGLHRHLRPALRRGGVVFLFDGLDEISSTPGSHGISLRTRVSRAVQAVARELPATPITLTCRVLPYEQPASTPANDWKLPADWVIQRIQPLQFGQVRQFVANWYSAACHAKDAIYCMDEGTDRSTKLLDQLAGNKRLRKLIESPLLLTMLALLHYNKETGNLPRDRAKLYDECVDLLLDRWEPVRQPGVRIPGMLERLGIDQIAKPEDLRAVMHRVALHAHNRPPDPGDGRGRLRGIEIEGELSRFLRNLRCDRIEDRLAAFEQALRDETGLLHEIGDDVYAFPHLTFQEYLAACALAEERDVVQRAYAFWSGTDSGRWREVLLLMVGKLRQQGAIDRQGMEWLRVLLNVHTPDGRTKSVPQRGADALLAADSYREWEGRAALRSYEVEEIDQIEQRIAHTLRVALDPQTTLSPDDRLRLGKHLADLGDPRFPVTHEAWQASLAQRGDTFTPTGEHYWRYLPAGRYRIGGWEEGEKVVDHEIAAFWVARLPITVAQFARFVAEGYREDRHWTENGLKWRGDRTSPYRWNDPRFNGANQAVIGVTWYEATAFCHWLTAHLSLPSGYVLRLPTEAEWEVAAAYDGSATPRWYPWGGNEDEPTPERAVYDAWKLDAPAPVGLCPAGMAACGALDLAGNVWEWCSSHYQQYPEAAYTLQEDFIPSDFVVPLRGGAHYTDSADVRCGARDGDRPDGGVNGDGFRVVVAPPLAHTS
nr:SUMF1/EgtB/PvdO family nonheme iron enzyme [Oscillochloris trichoides]